MFVLHACKTDGRGVPSRTSTSTPLTSKREVLPQDNTSARLALSADHMAAFCCGRVAPLGRNTRPHFRHPGRAGTPSRHSAHAAEIPTGSTAPGVLFNPHCRPEVGNHAALKRHVTETSRCLIPLRVRQSTAGCSEVKNIKQPRSPLICDGFAMEVDGKCTKLQRGWEETAAADARSTCCAASPGRLRRC